MLRQSKVKPTIWKGFIDDFFSLWDVSHETEIQPVHCVPSYKIDTEGEHFPRHNSAQGE